MGVAIGMAMVLASDSFKTISGVEVQNRAAVVVLGWSLVVLFVAGCVLTWRVGVRADEHGLQLRGIVARRQYEWSQIEAIRLQVRPLGRWAAAFGSGTLWLSRRQARFEAEAALHIVGGRAVALDWLSAHHREAVTPTSNAASLKVEALRRYREHVVGPTTDSVTVNLPSPLDGRSVFSLVSSLVAAAAISLMLSWAAGRLVLDPVVALGLLVFIARWWSGTWGRRTLN
ncbi:MAG: PH domain-containing protein [Actinomycetota bacterium]|nr:PH domain-containing protein [Actinomycetota bacterium]